MPNISFTTYRRAIVALALLGFAIASYFALYHFGAVNTVWDPFFGNGSREVLVGFEQLPTRPSTPVSIVVLLMCGYLIAGILATAGNHDRWHTIPWVVVALSLTVYLLVLIHLMIVLLEPILFHAWCTLCLASATISLAMAACVLPEFVKTVRYLRRGPATRQAAWKRLWGLPSAEQ